EEYSHCLAHVGAHRMFFGQGINCPIEYEVFGRFLHEPRITELLQPGFALGRRCVDFALHDVELVVGVRQSTRWLNQDQAVHAVGNVFGDHWRTAVINKQPRGCGLKCEGLRLSRDRLRECCTTARAECGMEINGVNHMAAGFITKSDLHHVTLPHPNHWARHLSVERPVAIRGANGWIQLTEYLLS